MKFVISFILLLILFFPFSVYAAETCYSVVVLNFVQGGGSCPTEPSNNPPPLPSNSACSVIGELVEYGNCTEVYRYCCDMTNVKQYENDIRMSYVVTGVGFGSEPTAAQTMFDQFMAEQAPGGCADTYSPAGFLAGFAYDTSMNLSGQSSDIGLSAWKRTLCAKAGQGEVIPLSSLSGGSGGGSGASYQNILDALNNSYIFSELQWIKDMIRGEGDGDSEFVTTNSLLSQILAKPGGAGGGGLSLSDTAAAVKTGLDSSVGVTPNSLGMTSVVKPSAYTNSELSSHSIIDFTNLISTFVSDVKQAPLFSTFSLSGLSAVPGGGSSSMPINFGSYGIINFDLQNYSGVFGAIKGVVLLLGSYLAVRVVILKR